MASNAAAAPPAAPAAAKVPIVIPASERSVSVVVVHPLVLLSVCDHYNRVARDVRGKRVVGVVLGEFSEGKVDITNSFALPFEEDPRDPTIFFLDHDYLESMYLMHRKISARERIVGFYSTGPRLRPADDAVDALFRRYVSRPVMVIIDTRPEIDGLPVQAYQSVDRVVDGKENVRVFEHVASEVGASEAEEVGVEHLLRDINDPSVSTLAGDVRGKLAGLKGLYARLGELSAYLRDTAAGTLPPHKGVLDAAQRLVAAVPDHSVESIGKALFETTNDQHLVLYTSALVRAVTALADVCANKARYRDAEGEADKEGKDAKDSKEGKEGKDGKDSKDAKEGKESKK